MAVHLVSIALPVYDGEKWLEQAISTLIKQSYENLEIILDKHGFIYSNKKNINFALQIGGITNRRMGGDIVQLAILFRVWLQQDQSTYFGNIGELLKP